MFRVISNAFFISSALISSVRTDDSYGFSSRSLETICPSGGVKDETGSFCCPSSCGVCGGEDCDQQESGASNCCTSQITQTCLLSDLPCIAVEKYVPGCPDDGILDDTGKYCCPSECGMCGGSFCFQAGNEFKCCTSRIVYPCITNFLPCILDEYFVVENDESLDSEGVCPDGGILDETGTVCCAGSCGQCGGDGCDTMPGGSSQCCTSQASNLCSSNTLPCLLDSSTSSSTDEEEESVCSDGILSEVFNPFIVCEAKFCCPKSCASCSKEYECFLEPECCAYNYIKEVDLSYSDADISCRSKSPPCLVFLEDDPCTNENPCQNEATCNVAWGSIWPNKTEGSCFPQIHCECEAAGNYSGEFCELACEEGETPCGESIGGYGFTEFVSNDICCSVDEVCLNWKEEYKYVKVCKSKDRPLSCNPDLCLNGGFCYNANIYNDADPYYVCKCLDGFGGVYCENEDS